jgi:hypothetical protein
MTVLWVAAPSSLVENERRFGGAYCLQHQGGNNRGSNYPSNVGQSLRNHSSQRSTPEDSHLHARRRKNVKSQEVKLN